MRIETDRFGWFLSDSSVRGGLEVNRFFDIEIPIPPKEIQQSIVDIYHAQYERQRIAEELNQILKESCPVFIRQSLSN
ncbi:MAG TPA: restriction endonuclease subunit S [Prolixibacteraceae bacterium]|nr:restriction endonuclease subunit S [Prolixibacteraceae bacterium]HRV88557.1 restriction endonuclease subunit S [Prolixibacteraceae bacterium]